MTTSFDRPLNGYRFVETVRGDTLQAIAARELGDAGRWPELIAFNSLVPPYITDDPAQVKAGVLRSGALIRLPAPVPVVSSTADPDQVFERDIGLSHGMLTAVSGDFAVLSGRDNLKQALKNRIKTERGELIFHTEYGSLVRRLIGTVNGPTAELLAAQYAKAAVLADPRIKNVTQTAAEVNGDVINVSVEAEPVAGRAMQISATP